MTRTTEYSEEIALSIAERMSEGDSLKKICESEDMPSRKTVYRWLIANPAFQIMVRAAREEHADNEFERLDEIIDQDPPKDDKGRVDTGWVHKQRLMVDTIKWKLARISPAKYSERIEMVGAGGQPLMPDPRMDDPIEMGKRIAFALAKTVQLIEGPNTLPKPVSVPNMTTPLLQHDPPHIDLYGKPIHRPWNFNDASF